jgi:hypothetical protein
MKNISIPLENPIQGLLVGFDEMPLKDLEYFIKELNALATRKRCLDKAKRNKFLLHKINQTILPDAIMARYIALQEKMEVTVLSDIEYQELLNLVNKEEKIRNKRFQYLLELAQLRGTNLAILMQDLGLNVLPNA